MNFWENLSPHTQSLLRWATTSKRSPETDSRFALATKPSAPLTAAQSLWPTLPSSARGAKVEAKRNVVSGDVGVAKTIWPNLKSGSG
jgi:hypothetical protein